jgi:hypothetical protein
MPRRYASIDCAEQNIQWCVVVALGCLSVLKRMCRVGGLREMDLLLQLTG